MFFNGLEVPGGIERMRETCSFHPVPIAPQSSFMVPIYDRELFKTSKDNAHRFVFPSFGGEVLNEGFEYF